MTNEELALDFQQGDAHAGEELLCKVEVLVRYQASKMWRDDSLLEDLLQEGRAAILDAAGGVSGKCFSICLYPSGEVSSVAAGG